MRGNGKKYEGLRRKLSDVFGYVDASDLKVSEVGRRVVFELESEEITYDKLCALSELLGTTKISLRSESRQGGSCSTCAYDYGVTVIEVSDVSGSVSPA